MSNIVVDREKRINACRCWIAWIGVVATSVYSMLFILLGFSPYYGRTVNVFTAIDMVFDVFNITGSSVYTSLVGLGLGIMFFVYAIIMIKTIVESIIHLKKALTAKTTSGDLEVSLLVIIDAYGRTLFKMISYIVISRMLFQFKLGGVAIAAICVGIIIHLALRILMSMMKEGNIVKALYDYGVNNLLFIVCLVILLVSVCTVDADKIFRSLAMIAPIVDNNTSFEIVRLLYELFAKNIILIVVQINALVILNDVLLYVHHKSTEKSKVRSEMISAIVLASVSVVVAIYTKGDVLYAFTQHAPCLLSAISLLLVWNMPMYEHSFMFVQPARSDFSKTVDVQEPVYSPESEMPEPEATYEFENSDVE